jgi:hypothetical protein
MRATGFARSTMSSAIRSGAVLAPIKALWRPGQIAVMLMPLVRPSQLLMQRARAEDGRRTQTPESTWRIASGLTSLTSACVPRTRPPRRRRSTYPRPTPLATKCRPSRLRADVHNRRPPVARRLPPDRQRPARPLARPANLFDFGRHKSPPWGGQSRHQTMPNSITECTRHFAPVCAVPCKPYYVHRICGN